MKPLFIHVQLALGLVVAIATGLLTVVILVEHAPDPARVYWDAAPSTVAVEIAPSGGNTTGSSGTGFFVTPHLLLTCAHVVDSARTCRLIHSFSDTGLTSVGHVLFADTLTDIAIVHTDTATQSPLKLGEAVIGAPVYAIGNPQGYLASFSSGLVSQLRKNQERERGLVQCTSTIGPGSSGGPLLDESGHVIGMTSFVDGDEESFYAFGIDAETLGHALSMLQIGLEKSRKPGWSSSLDTTGWSRVDPSELDSSRVSAPSSLGAAEEWEFVLDDVSTTLADFGLDYS